MPTAIRATYADIKTVRTRKVYQIVFEGPLEEMSAAMALFGPPMPDAEVWAGIARLKADAPESVVEQIEDHRPARLAQLAGILCNEKAFWTFLVERGHATENKEQAAEHVRLICGAIPSRADLDSNSQAGQKFKDLRADYQLWLRDAA